jgi:hypothetical protein
METRPLNLQPRRITVSTYQIELYSLKFKPLAHLIISALIKAWGFSKRADATERSEAILKQMQDMEQNPSGFHVTPNVRTYTALIMCYGLSRRPGAPQRAEKIVRQMDEEYRLGKLSEGPNKKTFITLRRAWSSSNEANKEQYAAAVQREIESRFRLGNA